MTMMPMTFLYPDSFVRVASISVVALEAAASDYNNATWRLLQKIRTPRCSQLACRAYHVNLISFTCLQRWARLWQMAVVLKNERVERWSPLQT